MKQVDAGVSAILYCSLPHAVHTVPKADSNFFPTKEM